MANFLKKAFSDMKESAKAQHEVDQENMAAVKAEFKAQWEEAKAMGKQSWDDAHMTPAERAEKMQVERDAKIAEANARTEAAKARTNAAKK